MSRPRVESPRQLVPLPAALVDELAHGHGGAEAVRHLALFQQSLRHRLLAEVCAVADARRPGATDALAAPTAHAVETLRHLDADARCHAAVADVLAHPCLRTWAVRVLERDAPPPADLAHLAAIAAAAAIRAGADADVAVPVRHGAVHLPTLGRLVIAPHQRAHRGAGTRAGTPCADCDPCDPRDPRDPSGASRAPDGADETYGPDWGTALVNLHIRGGSCSITAAPGWQAVRAIPLLGLAGGALAVEDTDPYRGIGVGAMAPAGLQAADAGRADSALTVAERIPREEWETWRRTAADAWDLLSRDHGRHASGIAAGLSTLIPLSAAVAEAAEASDAPAASSGSASGPEAAATPTTSHYRISSRPAFGSVAAALPGHGDAEADATALAFQLVRGFQRAKLAAVLDMADLHDPADPRWPEARWQDTYAGVAAADFWRVRRAAAAAPGAREHADAEFARCHGEASRSVDVLAAHPTLTPLGRRFADALAETLAGWTPGGR